MKSQLIAHGFRKIIRYDITPENPISNKDLEQMVSNMVDEVQERMGVLFEMYKERCGFDSSSSGERVLDPYRTSLSTKNCRGFNLHARLGEKVETAINVDSL
ncbi:hypothetical protein Tco_0563331 [Tanacetum coccineum]